MDNGSFVGDKCCPRVLPPGACRFNHLSKRWETYTGKLATQVGSDRSFEEVAEERLGPALGEEAA